MKSRILFVDDEENILKGYKLNLRKYFNVTTAISGKDAIEIINKSEPFAIIISDFMMPEMNGVEFLVKSKELSKDSVRVMITGYADMQNTIEAVNKGGIFRFLVKPISPTDLIINLKEAEEQYLLIQSEKELLNKTLKGSIKLLIDLLSTVKPTAFKQGQKYRLLTHKIANRINIKTNWETDISTMLSQIGLVALAEEILDKINDPKKIISDNTMEQFEKHAEYGYEFLKHIPRLKNIANIIRYQFINYDLSNADGQFEKASEIPVMSRMLKVINDYDFLWTQGRTAREAFVVMQKNKFKYDPKILTSLEAEILDIESGFTIQSVHFKNLRVNMVLYEDLRDTRGVLLLKKDTEITNIELMRLINSTKYREVQEPIKVLVQN